MTTPLNKQAEAVFMPHGIAHMLPPMTISIGQLRRAVEVMADAEFVDFQCKLPGKDVDGNHAPDGLYCWDRRHKDEGMVYLPQNIDAPAPTVQAVASIPRHLISLLVTQHKDGTAHKDIEMWAKDAASLLEQIAVSNPPPTASEGV
jgi:hypothetical protein